ncbi:urease accessory protein UreF [Riemerella columbina]|uniref:urease accessory protein UreF n=1 Tax=Riemerella columbina TaxID=103810 RepID=UPI00037F4CA3|nr:urease accessory protein UreF [Riemerella columbina]
MQTSFLGSLLHLADPTLPIGGYTHSNGLETYVQRRIVKNVPTAETFVKNMIEFNLKYNDGAFVRLAYEATEKNDLQTLLDLDQECTALKCPREIREASQKLGLRVIKIFRRQKEFDLMLKYEESVKKKTTDTNYCIVFGMFSQLMGIPLQEALFAFYYTSAVGMITNAVKLVPLGQLDGQDILFRLQPIIQKTTEETLDLDRDLVGLCNPAFDIRCMQHERLYSRLYMS